MKKKNSNEIELLEQWTEMKCSKILFDSTVDDWSYDTSEFKEKIIYQSHLVFLIEDEISEKFGFFTFENPTSLVWYKSHVSDFQFNLNITGNISQPMKYELINTKDYYCVYKRLLPELFVNYTIYIYKQLENQQNKSHFHVLDDHYNYHGITNPFGRKLSSYYYHYFCCKRLTVIQMN